MAVGEKETLSTPEKKFSGFLLSVIVPNSIKGHLQNGITLVGSKMLMPSKLSVSTLDGSMIRAKTVHLGKFFFFNNIEETAAHIVWILSSLLGCLLSGEGPDTTLWLHVYFYVVV